VFPDGAFGRYLSRRGVLLKGAGKFFESETETLIQHAKTTAEEAWRLYRYLASAHTHASGRSKEAMARAIAEQDGISEGLVCIFLVIEPCVSFAVAGSRQGCVAVHQILRVVCHDQNLPFYSNSSGVGVSGHIGTGGSRPGHHTPLRFTSMAGSGSVGNSGKWVSPSSVATTRFSGCRISKREPPLTAHDAGGRYG